MIDHFLQIITRFLYLQVTFMDNVSGVPSMRIKGVDPDTKVGGGRPIHVNPESSFGGTNGEPPSEASQVRKGGPGVLPRKI